MKKSVHTKSSHTIPVIDKSSSHTKTCTAKRILIADDDAGIQEIFQLIFMNAGFQTEMKKSGDEIFEKNFVIPDLFLIDRQLSGCDGLDVCRWLKNQEHTKHIPVIIVSATPNLNLLAHEAGADSFLEKPFELRELLRLVNDLIAVQIPGTVIHNK